LLSLFCMLYVDDGVFTFSTREQLKIGSNLIYSQFQKFGLEMHIERGSKASKTECVFPHHLGYGDKTVLHNIKPISVADGTVTVCLHFKYLGSWISYSLRDDYDATK